ncbi:hypothetical protein MGN70_000705 [Eutypa lata]|nr:hypothetical protein MGN70_000705 [Eutypa lata]
MEGISEVLTMADDLIWDHLSKALSFSTKEALRAGSLGAAELEFIAGLLDAVEVEHEIQCPLSARLLTGSTPRVSG